MSVSFLAKNLKNTTEESRKVVREWIVEFNRFGEKNMGSIWQVAELEPESVGINALAANLHLFGDSTGKKKAKALLDRVKPCRDSASEWEQLWWKATRANMKGYVDDAIQIHLEISRKFPGDLSSCLLGQSL